MSDAAAFHQRVATELRTWYEQDESPPAGWREVLGWHYEQAGDRRSACEVYLELVEAEAAQLDFISGRRRVERALELIAPLPEAERRAYERQGCALAIAVLEFQGQYHEALAYARQLLALAERSGDVPLEGRAYLAMGRLQREQGNFVLAEAEFQRALAIAERTGLLDLEFDIRLNLARLHQLQGRHFDALRQVDLAREDEESFGGDRARLARVYTVLGDICRVLGSYREALARYRRAQRLEEPVATSRAVAMLHDKIGLVLAELGQLDEAAMAQRQSLFLRERSHDLVGQARSLTMLGVIALRRGDPATAIGYFERVRSLEQRLQNRRGIVIASVNLGDAERARTNSAAAFDYYQQALNLARAGNDQIAIARICQRLGDVRDDLGDRRGALQFWKDAVRIREQLGHRDELLELHERLNRKPSTDE